MAIPSPRFDYGLVIGRFDTQRYLPLMHWQAQKAQQHLQATGQITVVIQDGLPFWQPRDSATLGCLAGARALFFFLPPHSPQMNRIEEEWLHLEGHELSAQLFEDEYDLAIALIEAIDERGQRRGYPVERFRFNSLASYLTLRGTYGSRSHNRNSVFFRS